MFDMGKAYSIGETASLTKVVSQVDITDMARITGDTNPLHIDEEYARGGRFGGCVAHGVLSAGLISAVLGTKLPGPGAIYLSQNLDFLKPVRVGDSLTATVEVVLWEPKSRIVRLKTWCCNQLGEKVVEGEATLLAAS